jgi:hypothetical protein
MNYDSEEDFRGFVDEINTASLDQGIHSNNDRGRFVKLIPKRFLNLIENDTLKEGFEPAKAEAIKSLEGDGQEKSDCGAFCGKRSPVCKDIRDGRTVCEGTINLDSQAKCESAFGGKSCKWATDEWRPCTAQCKKWNCENCKGTKHTANIDELEKIYNQTLKKYEQDYKSLGDPNLTQEEGERIAKEIQRSNELLLKISDEIYADIQKAEIQIEEDTIDTIKVDKESGAKLTEVKNIEKEVAEATAGDKTSHGEYNDNKLRVRHAYYSYVFWFCIVVIITCGIAAISAGVPMPTSRPLQGLLLMAALGLGYFLFTRIWSEYKKLLRKIGAS